MAATPEYIDQMIAKATSNKFNSLKDIEIAIEQDIRRNNVVMPIPLAKKFILSYKRRLKVAETQLLDLNGKLECDGLSDEEFNQKDALEEEVSELREIINQIKK